MSVIHCELDFLFLSFERKPGAYNREMATDDAQKTAELRTLALVDRIIGLEAEIAHLKYARDQGQLTDLQNSFTWKAGLAVTYPARALRKFIRKMK